jgi:hypothetical protein
VAHVLRILKVSIARIEWVPDSLVSHVCVDGVRSWDNETHQPLETWELQNQIYWNNSERRLERRLMFWQHSDGTLASS